MNYKSIMAIAVALTGSALFAFMISFRGHLTESWMRTLDSTLAFAILAGAFAVAFKVRDGDG